MVLTDDQMKSMRAQIGRQLTAARALAGMRQGDAAAAVGITSDSLSNYERGRYDIKLLTYMRLCELYGVDGGAILARIEPPVLD